MVKSVLVKFVFKGGFGVKDSYAKYYEVKNKPGVTHLKAEVYYSLGGYNVFNSRNEDRGYYMSIVPVKREDYKGHILESFVAFSGMKQCVLPVHRKSQKKMDEAVEYFNDNILDFMNNHFGEFEVVL